MIQLRQEELGKRTICVSPNSFFSYKRMVSESLLRYIFEMAYDI